MTERRSADATALKPEPVLLQKSAAGSTDDKGKDRLTQMKRILKKRGSEEAEEIREAMETLHELSY
nr:conotoxin precursor B1 [Conus judaeus]